MDRYHPARDDLEPLRGNRRAFAQATWRHLLFGLVLGELERRLNAEGEFEPLEDVPVASNGHGNIEHAAAGAPAPKRTERSPRRAALGSASTAGVAQG